MKMKIDLSQFKLISKDDKVAELEHPHGHTFRVAINALHPENRKNLDKLEKKEPTDKDPKVTKNDKDAVAGKPKQKLAEGGKVAKLEIEPIEQTSKGGIKYEAFDGKQPAPKHPVEYEAMAQGGSTSPDNGPKIDSTKAKAMQDGAMASGWQPQQWAKNVKDGMKMAEGGAVDDTIPAQDLTATPPPLPSDVAPTTATDQGFFGSLKNAASGISDAITGGVKSASNYIDSIGQPPEAAKIDSSPGMAPAPAPGPQGPAEVPKTPAQEVRGAMAEKGANIMDAFGQEKAGLAGQATAEGQLGNREANIQRDLAIKQKEAQHDFLANSKKIMSERENLQKDIAEGHIDPNHFVNSMSTVGKIQSAIGLILSGIGSGLTGKENMAQSYINQQISNDIEAQRVNLGKKQSLLEANYKQFGNLKDATEMTKMMMMDTANTQMKAAAAKAQDPLAKARLLQESGKLEAQIAPMQQTFEINRAMVAAADKDAVHGGGTAAQEAMLPYLRQVNPEKAKEIETRLVPGVGMAAVPVPSEARTKIIATNNLLAATKNLRKWSTQHGASLDPKVRAEGATLATELQQIYRQSVGASTSAEEAHTIESIINSNPANIFHAMNSDPKLKALEHSMNNSLSQLKKGYGLPTQSATEQLSPRQQQLLEVARRNPNHPNSQKIIQQLGGGR